LKSFARTTGSSDPPLARHIVESRAAIWDSLVDAKKFTESV
jgi:hypothetical protein